MAMHIIVGGGRVGRQLADRLEECIIIEKDEETCEELRRLGYRVVHADAREREVWERLPVRGATVILATNDDSVNIAIASIIRDFEPSDIVARVESESYMRDYRNLGVRGVSCGKTIASELIHELIEAKRRYFEIVVTEENFAGMRLADMYVGESCTIISIYREGKIYRPHPDFVLQVGDIVGIICGKEVKKTKNPFDEVLLVIRCAENYKRVYREAKAIAERFDADLLILHKEDGRIMCSLKADSIQDMDVEEAVEILESLTDKVDLIVTDPPKKKVDFRTSVLIKFPILFAKGKEGYRDILAIVNTDRPENVVSYATAFANYFGKGKIMFLDREQLKTSSSTVESPTVEIAVTEFNPLVEVVREVKRGYDLIIFSISNSVGNIDSEFLWKFILDTDSSVLVVR
ncbi:MAG: TrkA family potassium uptake protein [Archaeoglobi archaeon]|nr:TrkA family potassium uptake protein [Archaeoglobi archaeon]